MMNLVREERGSILMNVMLGMLVTMGIAATVTVVSSHYYGEGGFDMSNPLGGKVQGRVYMGKAVADMQAIGQANVGYFLKTGRYARDMEELLASGYVDSMPLEDPWGNPWIYMTEDNHFVLASYGSDGARGPEPAEDWDGNDTTPDLIMKDGNWVQAPRRDTKLKAVNEAVDARNARDERRQQALEKAGIQ